MSWGSCREAAVVRPHAETDDLQLPFSDPAQQRYELIRPLLLDPERTATQRAQETGTHPETVGRLKRRFAQQGMLGLGPDTLDVLPARRQLRVPETVVHELQRRKGQPFQHGHLCARSLAVETCLPFSYGIRFGGFFLGPRGCF